jgi:muramoyltetrapeptide carboxypeptidase
LIKPRNLTKGNTIGVIAPASPIYEQSRFYAGVEVLKKHGFNIHISENCFRKNGFLAGDDATRAKDINEFFKDTAIDGILCMRGGYGSLRLLNLIDYDIIKLNPKIFIGYSDITALHSAIHKKCNLITFHGPMLSSDIANDNAFDIEWLLAAVKGDIKKNVIEVLSKSPIDLSIKGRIIGGNLCVLCSMLGTPYEEDFNDKILFLEDIEEEPYKIDRMLQQLNYAGKFNKIRGVILGQFINCNPKDASKSFSLNYVLEEFFKTIDKPLFSGLIAGHGTSKITIPLGTYIEISKNKLYFKEEGVTNDEFSVSSSK